jgi:type I restriction enzyme S subunit
MGQKDLDDYSSPGKEGDVIDEQSQKFARRFYHSLPNQWRFAKLDDECKKFIDYRGKTPPKSDDGIHMISAANIKDGFILPERKEKFVSEDTYEEWTTRGIPQKHDVIITTEAPVGEVGIIRTEETLLPAQRLITMRPGESLDPRYLKFCLQYVKTQKQLESYASGTTVSSFNQTDLRNSVIPLPPLSEQKKIGKTLDNIEQKTTVNSRINELLEELAQTLYRSWFVDFDRYDELKDSELGEIPIEFEVVEFSEICKTSGGGTPNTDVDEYWDGSNKWLTPKEVTSLGSSIAYDTERKLTEEGLNNTSAKLMPPDSILLTSRATVGEVVINKEPMATNQGFICIKPNEDIQSYYMLQLVKNKRQVIEKLASGSTYPEISQTDFNGISVHLPPKEDRLRYEERVSEMYDKIYTNEKENDNLADLRDTLLPKLMSGEIRLDPDTNNGPASDGYTR